MADNSVVRKRMVSVHFTVGFKTVFGGLVTKAYISTDFMYAPKLVNHSKLCLLLIRAFVVISHGTSQRVRLAHQT